MWSDRVSNPGPLIYESGALPTALRGSAWYLYGKCSFNSDFRLSSYSVKIHLNMDHKQSSEFQDPTSSNSLNIVLTRFFLLL